MLFVGFLLIVFLSHLYHSTSERGMTIFIHDVRRRNEQNITPYILPSDATVTELIEIIIQHETSGIPLKTLRSSMSLEFAGIQIIKRKTHLLSYFGIRSQSVIVYHSNLCHIDGALVYHQGWCLKTIISEHIDLWLPCNPLQDISFWNELKTQIRNQIVSVHHNLEYTLSPNVSTVFRFVHDDSSDLDHAAATNCAYLWGHLPEWYGQYRIGNEQNAYLMTTKRIKSNRKLYRELQDVSFERVIPSSTLNHANVMRKSLLSQLRAFKLHPASGRKEKVFRRNDINVWDSAPAETDYLSVRLIIPQGFDVLFDSVPVSKS